MYCYTVIDTNVLVSALLSKNVDASTVQVLEELYKGNVTPGELLKIIRNHV